MPVVPYVSVPRSIRVLATSCIVSKALYAYYNMLVHDSCASSAICRTPARCMLRYAAAGHAAPREAQRAICPCACFVRAAALAGALCMSQQRQCIQPADLFAGHKRLAHAAHHAQRMHFGLHEIS